MLTIDLIYSILISTLYIIIMSYSNITHSQMNVSPGAEQNLTFMCLVTPMHETEQGVQEMPTSKTPVRLVATELGRLL